MTQPPEHPDQTPPPPPPYGSGQIPVGYGPAAGGHPTPQQPLPMAPQKSGLYQAAAIINWVMLGVVTLATCGTGSSPPPGSSR